LHYNRKKVNTLFFLSKLIMFRRRIVPLDTIATKVKRHPIAEDYIISDLALGLGRSGEVKSCINRRTQLKCAVKVRKVHCLVIQIDVLFQTCHLFVPSLGTERKAFINGGAHALAGQPRLSEHRSSARCL
jgi:hypothetical protein